VIALYLRWLILVMTSLSLVAVTLPVRAAVPKLPHTMSCCAHMPGQNNNDNHCGSEPVKQQDRPCCPACATGLSLFLTTAAPFIFSPDRAEELIAEIAASSWRSDRPPVPPPRA